MPLAWSFSPINQYQAISQIGSVKLVFGVKNMGTIINLRIKITPRKNLRLPPKGVVGAVSAT